MECCHQQTLKGNNSKSCKVSKKLEAIHSFNVVVSFKVKEVRANFTPCADTTSMFFCNLLRCYGSQDTFNQDIYATASCGGVDILWCKPKSSWSTAWAVRYAASVSDYQEWALLSFVVVRHAVMFVIQILHFWRHEPVRSIDFATCDIWDLNESTDGHLTYRPPHRSCWNNTVL